MAITYRDPSQASALSEFEERCGAFKSRLQSEDFLHNRGLGNEVGIYTFCYDPRLKAEARRFLDRLKGDPSLPCRIRRPTSTTSCWIYAPTRGFWMRCRRWRRSAGASSSRSACRAWRARRRSRRGSLPRRTCRAMCSLSRASARCTRS